MHTYSRHLRVRFVSLSLRHATFIIYDMLFDKSCARPDHAFRLSIQNPSKVKSFCVLSHPTSERGKEKRSFDAESYKIAN